MNQHSPSARYSQILKQERQRLGLSQKELAERVDATLVTISNWERGKTLPGPYHRRQLSVLFGKTLSELALLEEQTRDSSQEQLVPEPSLEEAPASVPLPTPGDVLFPPTPPLEQSLASPPSSQLPRRGFSRRTLLRGVVGVALASAVGGSIALLRSAPGAQNPLLPPVPASTGEIPLFTYRGHTDWVWSVAWSPDGQRIASGSSDETVQVWDATTGDHLIRYIGHSASVYSVAWSPGGGRLASASYDKTVQIWNPTFGDYFSTYTGHTDWVWSVAWSPDGRRIASGGGDKTVRVWDAADGSHLYTYRGHSAHIQAVAWSPDGKRLASAGDDQTVRIWDATNGHVFSTYTGHSHSVRAVAWSPDGKQIASGSWDKTVQVWRAG